VQERAAGNLEEAIKLYQRVAKEFASESALAARALEQAARCYEKLGQAKAVTLYEEVESNYPDQREQASIARDRLAKTANLARAAGTITRVSSSGRAHSPAALSPDGKYVAYAEGGFREPQQIWLRQLATGAAPQVLVPSAMVQINGILFAPDGNRIAYVSSERGAGTLFLIPALGGVPREVVRDVQGSVAFSPDGGQIAFVRFAGQGESRTSRLMLVRADGSGERQLIEKSFPDLLVPRVAWSPDGKWIACLKSDKILLVPAAGGSEQTLAGSREWNALNSVAWWTGPAGDQPARRGGARQAETACPTAARVTVAACSIWLRSTAGGGFRPGGFG
jgi:dipeptidyl aminopeptidase/acylaminoacyl peptidase